ncbi:hypothetical protein TNCV_381671 [Trichonephila clavipes]|uniref:Uncharacterized protein n=1 Tax=Trichonephila clavipes TaxID=2585209 RepID=A0A8X6SDY4_TRICX|nr:hypothetical protein TNCV_381671 [Trichonephila clavipes]
MITNFFIPELNNHDVQELWFQQDSATCHTDRATIDLLKDVCYTRAFGNGPRNFEPWSSDVDDTRADTPSPNYHTSPREDVSALYRFNVHRCPTRRVLWYWARTHDIHAMVRYPNHWATAALKIVGKLALMLKNPPP